jgi:hypothetical protein
MDPQSRDLIESAYSAGPVYQQPAMDDYGYGDPGYSDPSYDGPRTPYPGPGSPGGVPGYHVPETRDSVRPGYSGFQSPATSFGGQDLYPVTGAQEALRATGPQPLAAPWAAQDPDGVTPPGSSAYPDQWYDRPRLTDEVRGAAPAADSRSTDPRLEGIRYDELHYEEPAPDGPGYDDSIEDESWYAELRRGAPAFPPGFDDPPDPSGPVRRAEPPGPAYGQQGGHPQAPAAERIPGYGQPRPDRGGPDRGSPDQGSPDQGSPDRGSSGPQLSGPQMLSGPPMSGPQLSGVRTTSPGPRASGLPEPGSGPWMGGPGAARQPGPAFPRALAGQSTAFLAAPVGVLPPPTGSGAPQLDDLGAGQFLAPPVAGRPGAGTVRPGHGLDGPEITSSWPAQPPAEDFYAEFWQEDDEEVEYKGLFGDRDPACDDARTAAKRRIGRRRGRSNDHRLWLALGGVVILAATAITGIIKFEFPSHGGPVHTMVTPDRIGTYARTVDLERQTNVAQLRDEVIQMSSGQASRVVSGVYESGNSAAGNTTEIIMFIGGHLANAAPATSIGSFTQKFPGAKVVSPGALGGKAACVEEGSGTSNSVSMCAWFDNDSFGEIVSPTMNATGLAAAVLTMRPALEMVVKK